MKNKKIIIIIVIILLMLILGIVIYKKTYNNSNIINDVYEESDEIESWDENNDIDIDLTNRTTNVNNDIFNGENLYIKEGGIYHLTGDLEGYIHVDTKEVVRLVLDNVKISSEKYSSIFIENSKKTIVTLAENSKNYLIDTDEYNVDLDNEPNGTMFSKDELVINGSGYLEINSNYQDGIVSKDGLKILNSNITINSKDDGIRGKDFVSITNATLNIEAFGDGIKSTNDTDAALGYIKIYSGVYNISSNNDGLDAENSLIIENGTFNVLTKDETSLNSSKGIKAGNLIQINNGVFNINSKDDGIHSNSKITINDGVFEINSIDDAVHADELLEINNGEINVVTSYEGLEAEEIEINDGIININSSDDGMNASGGKDESGMAGPRPGQDYYASSNASILINGGYIYLNSLGDGFDSNGKAEMNGGTLIISGPINSGNGALDFDGTFKITNGLLVAAGSAGMVQTPSSIQNTLNITFDSMLSENTIIHIEDSNGNDILTYAPEKKYQSVVICSPDIKDNNTYIIYYGGLSTGEKLNGIYNGGNYNPGTEFMNATIIEKITNIGNNSFKSGRMPERR